MYFKANTKNGGFSLLELLIVVAVVATLSSLAVGHFIRAQRAAVLRTTAEQIQSVLLLARQRAIDQEQGLEWGVHFANPAGGGGFFETFQTTTYSPANVRGARNFLDPVLVFSSPSVGASTTVLFSRRTGEIASLVDIVLLLPRGQLTRTIRVHTTGIVEVL